MVGWYLNFGHYWRGAGRGFANRLLAQPYIYTFRMGISLPLLFAPTFSRERDLSVYFVGLSEWQTAVDFEVQVQTKSEATGSRGTVHVRRGAYTFEAQNSIGHYLIIFLIVMGKN